MGVAESIVLVSALLVIVLLAALGAVCGVLVTWAEDKNNKLNEEK